MDRMHARIIISADSQTTHLSYEAVFLQKHIGGYGVTNLVDLSHALRIDSDITKGLDATCPQTQEVVQRHLFTASCCSGKNPMDRLLPSSTHLNRIRTSLSYFDVTLSMNQDMFVSPLHMSRWFSGKKLRNVMQICTYLNEVCVPRHGVWYVLTWQQICQARNTPNLDTNNAR